MYEILFRDKDIENLHLDAEGYDIHWAIGLTNVVNTANEPVVDFWKTGDKTQYDDGFTDHKSKVRETVALVPLREIVSVVKRETGAGVDGPPKAFINVPAEITTPNEVKAFSQGVEAVEKAYGHDPDVTKWIVTGE